jgi:DNA-binding FadR family transcriptional regulator
MNEYSNFVLSTLRENEKQTRTGRLYDRIRQMIISGIIPAGYTFPNENEMCRQLQIGRSTLREVYQSLLADGLISRSKAGTTVNHADDIIRRGPFSVAIRFASFRDIFDFRMMLETEIVRAAALRATDEELSEIEALLKGAAERTLTPEQQQQLDLSFHHMLVNYSHNPLLINVFSNVWIAFETMLLENHKVLRRSSPQTLADALPQHRAICDALLRRDQEGACKAMRDHLNAVSAQTLLSSEADTAPLSSL